MKTASSFRDPSGFIFTENDVVFRQINTVYKDDYEHLMGSGLYEALVKKGLLVTHEEVQMKAPDKISAYKCIKPQQIPFISYPYEWSFSQLKRAALLTLRVQSTALAHGMVLKDASAFNVQFIGYQPVFIDTLSFEKYKEQRPWVAYKQFCEHFLAPLLLMSYKHISLHKILRVFLDGIPLPVASTLLPLRTYLKFSILSHVHLHAKAQKKYEGAQKANYTQKMSKQKLTILLQTLEQAVKAISWKPEGTEWSDYYNDTNYTDVSLDTKKKHIKEALTQYRPTSVWDIGANTGVFSRIASDTGIPTVSFDIDEAAVEKNYRQTVLKKEKNILPLVMDISNASPGLGWLLDERSSLVKRGPADMTIALALIHHLTIGGNAPFEMVANFFKTFSNTLLIEFVPKNDSQVQRLLASREDIFTSYDKDTFEKAFGLYFAIQKEIPIEGSERVLYIMTKKV